MLMIPKLQSTAMRPKQDIPTNKHTREIAKTAAPDDTANIIPPDDRATGKFALAYADQGRARSCRPQGGCEEGHNRGQSGIV